MRKEDRKSFGLLRCAILTLIAFLLFFPSFSKYKNKKDYEKFLVRAEQIEEEAKKEWDAWNKKTPQEKFIWCIMDMDQKADGMLFKADWDVNDKIIYVYCATEKKPNDNMETEKEFRDSMVNFAVASNVTDKIYLVGWNEKRQTVWMMDDLGRISWKEE